MPIKRSATAPSGRRTEAPICARCSRAAASSFSDLARERTRARRDEEARGQQQQPQQQMSMDPHAAEPHHLSRLEKLPPVNHIDGPEVEDDSQKDGRQSDDTDGQSPVMPPASQPSQQHHSRMYPWLDITTIAMSSSATTTANHPTNASVQHQRVHSEYTQQQVSIMSKAVRSEPARHGYNTITVHSNSDVTNDSSVSTTGTEHLNVRTRLLPPPAPVRTTSNRELWRPINSIVTSYTSNPGQGRRHSILRFGSTRRASSERAMKKSASVEFTLHDEDRVKRSPSFRKDITRISFGRDAPRRLTEEEKEELYRIRPDLEIGPTPFFREQMEELNRRNQKRILFSMFGGIMTIVLLLVFYALFARG